MIKIIDVTKKYLTKNNEVFALNKINLNIKKNEFVVIKGPSGSGKTTLLLTIGGMLKPNFGNIIFENEDVYKLSISKRSEFRRNNISFVFQMFHLIPYLNVMENILLGKQGIEKSKAKEQVYEILKTIDLEDRLEHKPSELSTGECQRVAVGRGIYSGSKLLLADEPTGNLDPENADKVLQSFKQFHTNGGTVITVTHGDFGEDYCDRIINLNMGRVVG